MYYFPVSRGSGIWGGFDSSLHQATALGLGHWKASPGLENGLWAHRVLWAGGPTGRSHGPLPKADSASS